MNKKQFQEIIKPMLKENDKPFNRQVWNDSLYHYESQLPNRAFSWVKTPKKYYN